MAGRQIDSVQRLLEAIRNSGLTDQDHGHLRVWFRGQPREGWPLRPGVYRDALGELSGKDRLHRERHLSQEFRVQSSALRRGNETEGELYFLEQHYGMPTRLLDWTNNPLAALYFAAIDQEGHNGELFMVDAYEFRPPLGASRSFQGHDFRGIATIGHPVFEKALRPIFRWQPDDFPAFVIPVRPPYSDIRITSQRSCFTFHVPDQSVIDEKANPTLQVFQVPKDAKTNVVKELRLLGIDDFGVFGDLSALSKTLRRDYRVNS